LHESRRKYNADGIVTAHHQDDVIETMLINLTRGTNWRGLCSLRNHPTLLRPLLRTPKSTILAYARQYGLGWVEDETNQDERYLRNYIRHTLVPSMVTQQPNFKEIFISHYELQLKLLEDITSELNEIVKKSTSQNNERIVLRRYDLIMWPAAVSHEVLQHCCKLMSGHAILSSQAEGALLFAKTAKPHKALIPNKSLRMRTTRSELIVERV
jgi:tRNA(Ile)-lysidine synthase